MTDDKDLVLRTIALAAETIAERLQWHSEILQEERAAGVIDQDSEKAAMEWIRAALDLWREFMPK